MKKLYLIITILTCSFSLYAQPTVIGTSLPNGTYTAYDLNDLGSFRQILFLSTGASGSNRTWEFARGTAAATDYSTNWRPYDPSISISGYNEVIAPNTTYPPPTGTATYNTSSGGSSGVLPLVSASTYYTVNITELSSASLTNEYMAILETSFFPKTIVSVSTPACIDECGASVTVFLASAPDPAEHVYIRYSTDGFVTSSLAEATFVGQTGTATIPGQGAGVSVSYYAYSSNKTAAQILDEVVTHGQVAHDMLTLKLRTNGSGNFSVAACVPYTTPPVANCQSTVVDLDAGGNGVLLAADVDGGSFDACGSVTLAASPNSFTCSDYGSNTVTLTVTDQASNVATCTASVTVSDPLMACLPVAICQDATVGLDLNGQYSLASSEVDNGSSSDAGVQSVSVSPNTFDCNSIALNDHTVTLLVTGNNGAQATCTAAVTVQDQVAPSALCVGPISVTLNAGATRSLATNEIDNGSSDNCSTVNLSVTPNNFNCNHIGDNTVTLNAVDGQSNASSCTATVNVSDPLNACCAAITPNLTFSSTFFNKTICAGVVPHFAPDGVVGRASNSAAQAIKVDITPVGVLYASNSYTFTQLSRSLETSPLGGSGTVTYVVTAYSFGPNGVNEQGGGDDCLGQMETYVVTVEPKPTATVSGGGTACPGVTIPDVSIALTGTGPWSLTYHDGTSNTTVNPVNSSPYIISNPADGTYTVPNVTDLGETLNCSNTGTGSAVVLHQDNVNPTATCQPLTVCLDANGQVSVPYSNTPLANSVNDFSGTQGANGWEYGGYPAFSSAAFSQFPNYLSGTAEWKNTGANFHLLSATSGHPHEGNLDWAVRRWTSNFTGAIQISGDFFDQNLACGAGAHVRILKNGTQVFEYLNIPGTSTSYSISLCVLTGDKIDFAIDPIFDPFCDLTYFTAEIIGLGNLSSLNDNCGIGGVLASKSAFTCSDLGSNPVLLTVTDVAGNTATCNTTVNVEDQMNPTALCQPYTVTLDGTGNGSLMPSDIDNISSDNCDVSLTASPTTFDCSHTGATQDVILTVTDPSGNSDQCTAVVTVEDNTAPTAICQVATVQLDANGNGTLLASAVNNGSFDVCNPIVISVSPNTFDCTSISGSNTVTLTVEDPSGNQATCTAAVTVVDQVGPTAICQDVTVELDGNGNATIAVSDVDNGSTDNCGISTLSVTPNTFDCSHVASSPQVVTLTVTNNNAVQGTCTAGVTVVDDTPPILTCQNVTLQLPANGIGTGLGNALINGAIITRSDNCGLAGINTTGPPNVNCTWVGTFTRRLDQYDVNGNLTQCLYDLTLQDVTPPTAICQPQTVQLDGTGNATLIASDLSNGSSDACGIVSYSASRTAFSCADLGSGQNVVLTVADVNGNTATCNSTVAVENNNIPAASCQSITISLDNTGNASIAASEIGAGSGSVCSGSTLSASPTAFDCNDVGANTLTLTVTDNSNNSSSCTASVWVDDNPPIALCQDITVTLDNTGNIAIAASDVDLNSSDDCGIVTSGVSPSTFDCNDAGSNTVTLSVTDANGNGANCTATVDVNWDPISFSAAPQVVCQNGTVSFTDNSQDAVSWSWDFGDGSNGSTQQNPTHVYPAADTGQYDVTLTITTSDGCTFSKTVSQYIYIVQPIARFDLTPADGCAPLTVFFTDQSTLPDTWFWDFGDGNTSTLQNPVHLYTGPGIYDVMLTVVDTVNGCVSTLIYADTIEVDKMTADFTGGPLFGCAPLPVNFTDNSSTALGQSSITQWSWDFGDGNTSTAQNPSHTYDKPGFYTVTLTSTADNGCIGVKTRTNYVQAIGPDVNFGADTTFGCNGLLVNFTDSTIFGAPITSWSWDFGDGNTSNLQNPTHVYVVGDTVDVSLTVTDIDGCSRTFTRAAYIEVEQCCDPPAAFCQDITVQLDANGEYSLVASEVDNGSSADCGGLELDVDPNFFSCADIGSNVVTLTALDINEDADQCTATVTIQDNTPPAFSTLACSTSNATGTDYADGWDPGDNDGSGFGPWQLLRLLNTPSSGAGFFRGDSRLNGSPGAVINDPNGDGDINSGGFALGLYANNGAVAEAHRPISSPLVPGSSFSVEFDNGNIVPGGSVSLSLRNASHEFLLRIQFPGGNSTYELIDDNGVNQFTSIGFTDQGLLLEVELLSVTQANVTLTRRIDNVSQTLLATLRSPSSGSQVISRFLALNGNAGPGPDKDLFINNMAVCHPAAGCPGNVSVNTDPGQCGATVTYEEIVASDNCTRPVQVSQTMGQASGTLFSVGTTTNTFTATDASGNTASCSFDVTVSDNEPPTITCQDLTVSLDANGQVSVPVSNTPIANSANDFFGTQGANGWEYGLHSAFDYAGFTRLPNFTGSVWNNPGPTLDFPQLDYQGGHPDLDNLLWAVRRWTSNITGSIRITGDFFDRDGSCGDGAHVRIFKNGTEVYQYLNVPTTLVSYDLTIPINVGDHIDFVIDPILTAGCDDTHFTAQISELGNTSSYDDNCGIASVSASRSTFSCTDMGSHTVTMTVTDVNNNTATCTSEVTVVDALAPVAKCQDVTVQLDANGQYQFAASEADNGSSDNCQLASVVVNGFSSFTLNCSHVNQVNSAKLFATDASGNTSICDFFITVLDVTPPTAICQPTTVVLSAVDGTGSITAADVNGGSSDACTISSLSVSPSTFDCSMVGDNPVTLTVIDNNGNVSTCTATVTVDDSQSKPATLAQQSCGNCGLLRIFYCQFDLAPASLNDFIDGTVAMNANYAAGNTLYWYDDNSGSQGLPHMGSGQEPATPNMNTGNATYWYWVSQIDQNTGCFSDPIRVRVRVRKTPTPVFNAPSTPFCEGAQFNPATLIDDPNNVADGFDFYDDDPANGGTLIGSVTATNGSVDPGQVIVVTPVVGSNTYWVVATNAGNANTITCPATTSMTFVVTAKPVVTPVADVTVCPGDPVLVNFSATPAGSPIFVWTNSNTNIGLAMSGFNTMSFTAAANTNGASEVGNIAVRAIVNGCPSDVENFDITVESDAVIDAASSVTVCSGQPSGMTLTTSIGSPAAASYELVSVNLDPGLVADGGNQAPTTGLAANALAGDMFTNTTSGSLTATYSLVTVTASGCTSDVQTVTVSILPQPAVTAGLKDTVCSGQPSDLGLTTTNALPGTSFSWSPQSLPSGISLISSSSPGTVIADILTNSTAAPIDVIYDVTAMAGNCASIVVPCTIRVVPFPAVPATASLDACEDLTTPGQASFNLSSLDVSIGSGLSVNYFTDPNLLNQILQPGAFLSGNAIVYASVVNPGAPCPNRTDVSLTVTSLAVPQVSSTFLPCTNTSQEIIPAAVLGISFNFYNNDPDLGGLLLGSGSSYDPMLSAGQSQVIWVTATDGTCESDAVSTTVTVNSAPVATITSNLSNNSICEGDTLELFGAGGGTYSWTGPNNFSSNQQNIRIEGFVLADTGEYILTVSNGSCHNGDTLYVVGNRKADAGGNGFLTIAANAQPVDLFDYLTGLPERGGIWAGPSAPYASDSGRFNPNFMYAGVYTYTLTNPAGCRDSVSIATVTVNVTPVTAVKVKARVYLEGVLDTTTLLMKDSLARTNIMPTVEPYSTLGYVHVNGGGNESFPVEQLDTTGVDALVDWVYIELRSATDNTHIVATRSALLQRDGDVVELDGVSSVCFNRVTPGFYYVVIGHRNHLKVMTAIPVYLNSAGAISLDFTSGALGVYGTTPQNNTATSILTGGVNVMIGGDADFNGQIQNVDDVTHWIPFVGAAGYLRADYDCDGQVQNNDRVFIWAPNVGKGTQVPLRSN